MHGHHKAKQRLQKQAKQQMSLREMDTEKQAVYGIHTLRSCRFAFFDGRAGQEKHIEKLRIKIFFFCSSKHSPEAAKVSSRALCYTAGAPPGSYSIFKAGPPLAKRGDTAFSCRHYTVCCLLRPRVQIEDNFQEP